MKMRSDFVTNSSSSSFLIAKKYLDKDQIDAIHHHIEMMTEMKMIDESLKDDEWDIDETDDFISGFTSSDDLPMENFLQKIQVAECVVTWGVWPLDEDDYEDVNPYFRRDWRDLLHQILEKENRE